MNTGKVSVIGCVAAMLLLSGCSTASVQPVAVESAPPIMSAADTKSMIHVEVKALQPEDGEQTLIASIV